MLASARVLPRRLGRGGRARVNLYVALICFPVIFLGELPDKTMFAALLMATKGQAAHVWLGAAAAFVVHVVLAVTVGVAIFALLPAHVINYVVAGGFLLAAVYSWRGDASEEEEEVAGQPSRRSMVLAAFGIVLVAEWGDLTQILTVNLAAKYHSPLSVGVGALLALWSAAAIAVVSGSTLTRLVNLSVLRKATAVILLGLAAYSAYTAIA